MTSAGGDTFTATVLREDDPRDTQVLTELRADPGIAFIDGWAEQRDELAALKPHASAAAQAEPKFWVYYPWRRTAASVLGPLGFRAVRLNRNRNLITGEEQDKLGRLTVGVVGLSVGHAIAHLLAQEGLCGRLRLADFDELELSNLNRVPASVFDLGVNKATVTARRIAEIDPYLQVDVFDRGITAQNVGPFLDGVDILVEECDSLDTKVLVRQTARARRIPVLMATGDRGTLDVERFDTEPERQILHDLLGDLDPAVLAGLPSEDKVPYALRMMDGAQLSPRMAASLVEVGTTLSTWPQLAAEVTQSAALVAEAVRRIGLGEQLGSGRVRIDVASHLDAIDEQEPPQPVNAATSRRADRVPADAVARAVAAAARAPSGGNVQPWRIAADDTTITITLAPEHTSTMDVGYRASAVAVGAAAFNARVSAARDGILGPVRFESGDETGPLRAILRLADRADPELAALHEAMLARETNRHHGKKVSLPDDVIDDLAAAARREGARLHLLSAPEEISAAADLLAASDRIRYLTPRLHSEMISEVRFPGDPEQDSGIDVVSLELPPADLVKLDVLRRSDVMARLAEWGLGAALGSDTRSRVLAGSCLAVVATTGATLADYARAGSAVEAVWVIAQKLGLAVQPVSPVFLYARDDEDFETLSPAFATTLERLAAQFRALSAIDPDESVALVLRFADAPATSVRSQRRAIDTSSLLA